MNTNIISYKEFDHVYMPDNLSDLANKFNLRPSRVKILKTIIKYSQFSSLHACFFSERELAKITGYQVMAIVKSLRDLRKAHLINTEKLLDMNNRKGMNYLVNEQLKRVFIINYVNWETLGKEPNYQI